MKAEQFGGDYSYTVDRKAALAEAQLAIAAILHAKEIHWTHWSDAIAGRLHGKGLEAWFTFFVGYALATASAEDREYLNQFQSVTIRDSTTCAFAVEVKGYGETERGRVFADMLSKWIDTFLQGVKRDAEV